MPSWYRETSCQLRIQTSVRVNLKIEFLLKTVLECKARVAHFIIVHDQFSQTKYASFVFFFFWYRFLASEDVNFQNVFIMLSVSEYGLKQLTVQSSKQSHIKKRNCHLVYFFAHQ